MNPCQGNGTLVPPSTPHTIFTSGRSKEEWIVGGSGYLYVRVGDSLVDSNDVVQSDRSRDGVSSGR